MMRYLSITRGSILRVATFRFNCFFTVIGNLISITFIYFLWKAIYCNTTNKIHGMTFNDTFLYLTLASSFFSILYASTDWIVAQSMLYGNIILYLIKPTDYLLHVLFERIGMVIINFIIVFLPSVGLLIIIFHANINLGPNIIFFLISILFAFLVNFLIDFMVGVAAFYTETILGLSMTKEVVVCLLSGAIIPLQFFPESIYKIVKLLPFQAIYNIPLKIITNSNLVISDYIYFLLFQIFWIAILLILNRIVFKKACKRITVNGG